MCRTISRKTNFKPASGGAIWPPAASLGLCRERALPRWIGLKYFCR